MRAAASPKYLCIFTFYSRFILDLAPLRQFINKLFTPLKISTTSTCDVGEVSLLRLEGGTDTYGAFRGLFPVRNNISIVALQCFTLNSNIFIASYVLFHKNIFIFIKSVF